MIVRPRHAERSGRGYLARSANGGCRGLKSPDKALFSILARRTNENAARPPGGKEKTEPLTRDLRSLATDTRPPDETVGLTAGGEADLTAAERFRFPHSLAVSRGMIRKATGFLVGMGRAGLWVCCTRAPDSAGRCSIRTRGIPIRYKRYPRDPVNVGRE